MPELDCTRVRELLNYDPETGYFCWKKPVSNCIKVGKPINSINRSGYTVIRVDGTLYYAHRLAWLWMVGMFPKEIDHLNGIRSDNRWANLREANREINTKNIARRSDNKSGTTGVIWEKRRQHWVVRINVDGRQRHLGSFSNIEDAIAAREEAIISYGYGPHHGCSISSTQC